jgi:septal ring factor EnvC (AmiA/AmiB activator)
MSTSITPNDRVHLPKNSNGHGLADIDLERDLGQLLAASTAPRPESLPKPSDDLGRMSGEAIMAQYEAAAKSVEEMGENVKDRTAKLEAALADCDADMKLIREAATFIREKGKHVQAQIEAASAASNEIRSAVVEFKRKVGQ